MGNTQTRLFDLHDAIARDRASCLAKQQHDLPASPSRNKALHVPLSHLPLARHWELWMTIGAGLSVMFIAAFF